MKFWRNKLFSRLFFFGRLPMLTVIVGLLFFTSPSKAQLSYPENIQFSYSLGILYNSRLHQETVWKYAAVILDRNYAQGERQRVLGTHCCAAMESAYRFATEIFEVDYLEMSVEQVKKRGLFESVTNSEFADVTTPLIFKKNGQEFIRWFVHPLRTDTDKILAAFGRKSFSRGRFKAQFTESRSLIIFDSKSGGIWSVKSGLPDGLNPGERKSFSFSEAFEQVKFGQIISRLEKTGRIPSRTYQTELAGIGVEIKSFQEGQSARRIQLPKNSIFIPSSAVFSKGLRYFIPGLNADEELAKLRALIVALADKNAQLAAATGLLQNSNHTQNNGLILDQTDGQSEFINRDPDFDLDPNNPNSKSLYPFFNKVRARITRGIDFRFTASTPQGTTAYTNNFLRTLQLDYMTAFQKGYLKAKTGVAPIAFVSSDKDFVALTSSHLASMETGRSQEVLAKEAEMTLSKLEESKNTKYFEFLTREGARGLTQILTAQLLEPETIESLALAILQVIAIDTPEFWQNYLGLIFKNLKKTNFSLSRNSRFGIANLVALNVAINDQLPSFAVGAKSKSAMERLKILAFRAPNSDVGSSCRSLFQIILN